MEKQRYEVELDGELLDVLASETRRGILQSLGDRRRTLSELARDLDRNKSTIHEHLGRLTDADLVLRDENEDRKWTYYELTDEGERIVNPGGTPIRLVIGAAVAGLLAGLVVAGTLAGLGGVLPSEPADEGAQAGRDAGGDVDTLQVQSATDEALSSGGTTLTATVPQGDELEGPWRAYLVPEAQAEALTHGGTPEGIQVNATVDGDRLTLELPGDVRPGDYRLYVVAGDRRADVEDLPEIRLRESLVSVTNATYWRGFTGPATVERAAQVVPADADVVARPVDGSGAAAAATMEGGEATFSTKVLDTLPDGGYRLVALPDDGPPVPLGATLEVGTPDVVVTPQVLREDAPVDVRVRLQPAAAADAGVPVAAGGEDQETAPIDEATRTFRITPSKPGPLAVEVGRVVQETLTVLPDVDATVAVVDGPAWEVSVRDEAGEPQAGVDVRVDGVYRATTNASGEARLAVPDEGVHAFGLDPAGSPAVETAVEVEGWNATILEPRLGLSAAATSTSPGRVNVSVTAENDRPATQAGTLVARVGGAPAGVGAVTVPPGGNATEVLDVANATGGDLEVDVEAAAPTSASLDVENRTAGASGADDEDDGGMSLGGGSTEEGTVTAGSTRVNATVEGLDDAAGAASSLLSPERIDETAPPSGADAGEAAGAPGPGPVAGLAALAAGAAALRRRRRRY